MFARTPRLGNTPSRARSPGTAATPAATTPRGRPGASTDLATSISPRCGRPPVSRGASDSRPDPVMPATPTISPARTAKSSPRIRPPAGGGPAGPHSRSPSPWAAGCRVPASGTRAEWPTISSVSRRWSTSPLGTDAATRPSRRTVIRSAMSRTSPRWCETSSTPWPSARSAADRLKQPVDVPGGQGGRRFVEHDQQPPVPGVGQGPRDRDRGALAHAERSDRRPDIGIHAYPAQVAACPVGRLAPPDPAAKADRVRAAEHHVVENAQLQDQGEILVDEAESRRTRRVGAAELERAGRPVRPRLPARADGSRKAA